MKIFRQLRWQLTLNYTLVTVSTLLVITVVAGALALVRLFGEESYLPPGDDPNLYITGFMDVENSTSSYLYYCQVLSQTPQDLALVSRMLTKMQSVFTRYDMFQLGQVKVTATTVGALRAAVFRPDGTLLGSSIADDPAFAGRIGQVYDPTRVAGLEAPFRAAQAGSTDGSRLYTELEKGQRYIFAAPCFDRSGGDPTRVTGLIVLLFDAVPTQNDIPWYVLGVGASSLVVFLLFTGIMGALFGSYFAHGLASRFRQLATATDRWSEGDFSNYIDDATGDEISQFAQRLNSMAKQLQTLLRKRQDIAVSEERRRLARELHDSAKQQALAASFELGTALTLYERQPDEARMHVAQADTLVDSVRKELTDLVDELGPQSVDGQDFVELLKAHASDWSRRNGIQLNLNIEGDGRLPLAARETLFRITQEALANVARHSAASNVDLSLEQGEGTVTLTVKDNGRGFDTSGQYDGLGLHSMHERAEALGGSFAVESAPESGTRIIVTVPKLSRRMYHG